MMVIGADEMFRILRCKLDEGKYGICCLIVE